MKKIIPFVFLLWLSQMFSMCEDNSENQPNLEINMSEKSEKLVEADNKFGLELFQRVINVDDTENIMISPLSVSMALAMTYNGADGETKKAMEETLKLNGLTPEDINSSYKTLVEALASLDPKVVLEIANSIFYREGFRVKDEFISTNCKYYDAEVSALDFGSPSALETINNWVADKTHDKITKIIDEISPDHIMFLLNAIYFKGIWQKEFNEESTFKRSFKKANGEFVEVDMMAKKDTLKYFTNDLFQVVEVPYGKGNYNMQVFLPHNEKNVGDIIGKLDNDTWKEWMSKLNKEEKVELQLPKFQFKYEIILNEVLSAMGLQIAFTSGADFSGIHETVPLRIDYVKHKTFVEVNEEGTEAAAVTIVAIERTSIGPSEFIPFHVDRPFLFTITEKDTGAILFIAKVMHPVYED